MANKSLSEIFVGKRTDKHTDHTYDTVYDDLFKSKQTTAKNVLEIGICEGGSIISWYEYFENAVITGVDIGMDMKQYQREIPVSERIRLVYENAYTDEMVKFLSDRKYDIIIDDGPHTLESMQFFASKYANLLEDDGILVIEDVQGIEWVKDIIPFFPSELQKFVMVIDLRPAKGRWDDILIVLKKRTVVM